MIRLFFLTVICAASTSSVRPLGLIAAVLVLAGPLAAQFVTPTSYTATPGQGQAQGLSYNYFDDGGAQLTDRVYGVNDWTANLGHGNAQEWVGWLSVDPTVTFNFAGTVGISAVTIGFNRGQGAGIYLPPSVQIASQTFSLAIDAFPDNSRQDLTFNLTQPFFGNQLTVTLSDGNPGQWIFVDEMQFAAAVPEPSAVVLLGLGVLAGAGVYWRNRRR